MMYHVLDGDEKNIKKYIQDIKKDKRIKKLENEKNVVISLAIEKRDKKRPILADLRESGSIEQDADLVTFIYRNDYYEEDESKHTGKAEIRISKHRNGPIGKVDMYFNKEYALFSNLSKSFQTEDRSD